MSKNLRFVKVLLIVIITSFFVLSFQKDSKLLANNKISSSEFASYEQTEVLAKNNLGYGVEHLKVNGSSTANRCNNQNNTIGSSQVVNVLSVPSRTDVRIVNYTYPNATGWTKQTLTKIAENFENTHPGWVVIAGVNGDFYDINGKDKALPYHTTGSTLSDGDLLRAIESKSIGYTNNGTNKSFISTDKLSFSSYHILTVYDENDNIIENFQVDYLNTKPKDDGIAIYYTYKVNVSDNLGNTTAELVENIVPSQNSYLVENPIRCLPTSNVIYAKGLITKTNMERTLNFGQFAIVTTNQKVIDSLNIGVKVRVQKEVLGEMAECDQIQAVGSTLMKDGEISTDNSDGMRYDRHPRTCIGVKEDGTLMFFVIDGRQINDGMCGMTQDEQGVLMDYYGCYEGYNIDGGGSTTMAIRNENGEFVVMNSPSDSKERSNSNFLLITVPDLKLKFSEQSDTSVKLSYGRLSKGIELSNMIVDINGIKKEMTEEEMLFTGLNPNTDCVINYTYDITYNGMTTNKKGITMKFKTGKIAPKIINSYFDIIDDFVSYHFTIVDVSNTISVVTYRSPKDSKIINKLDNNVYKYRLSELKTLKATINVNYEVGSEPNRSSRLTEIINWYPVGIELDSYCKIEREKILSIISNINEQIEELPSDELVKLINQAKLEISKFKLGNHVVSDWIIDSNPTCQEAGKKHKECVECKTVLEEEIIKKLEHDFAEATTEAPKTCKLCGYTVGEKLEKKGCKKNCIANIIGMLTFFTSTIYLIRKRKK